MSTPPSGLNAARATLARLSTWGEATGSVAGAGPGIGRAIVPAVIRCALNTACARATGAASDRRTPATARPAIARRWVGGRIMSLTPVGKGHHEGTLRRGGILLK